MVLASDTTGVLVEAFGDLILSTATIPADRVDVSREERYVIERIVCCLALKLTVVISGIKSAGNASMQSAAFLKSFNQKYT